MKRVFSIIIFCLTVLDFFATGRARGHSVSWAQASGWQNTRTVGFFDSRLISYNAKERLDAVLIPQKDDHTSLVPYLQVSYQGNTPKVASLTWGSNGDTVTEHFIGDGTVTHTDIDGLAYIYVFQGSFDDHDANCMLCDSVTVGNKTSTFGYNGERQQTSITFPEGNAVAYAFTSNPSGQTDQRGNANLSSITYTAGARGNGGVADNRAAPLSESFTYTGTFKQLDVYTAMDGTTTDFDYNPVNGQLTAVKSSDQNGATRTTQYTDYNDYGQLLGATEPDGTITRLNYYDSSMAHVDAEDREGYLYSVSVTDSKDGAKILRTVTTLDHYGRVLSVTQPNGATSAIKFNDLDQVVETRGAPLKESDEQSRVIESFVYNARGFPTETTRKDPVPSGGTPEAPDYVHQALSVRTEYDNLNRTTRSWFNAAGETHETIYAYRDARLRSIRAPDQTYTVYKYNADGTVHEVLANMTADQDTLTADASGIRYEYNDNDEVAKTTYLFDGLVLNGAEITRDGFGRAAKVVNKINDNFRYAKWNAQGQPFAGQAFSAQNQILADVSQTYQNGFPHMATVHTRLDTTIQREVDLALNKVTIKDPRQNQHHSYYSGIGNLLKAETPNQVMVATYDAYGRHAKQAVGQTEADAQANLTDAPEKERRIDGLSTLFRTFDFVANGARSLMALTGWGAPSQTEDERGIKSAIEYDELGRIIRIVEDVGGKNRTTEIKRNLTQRTTVVLYKKEGQTEHMAVRQSYDVAGRLVEKRWFFKAINVDTLGSESEAEIYAYDTLSRITSVTYRDNSVKTFEYHDGPFPKRMLYRLRYIKNGAGKVLQEYADYNQFGAPTRIIHNNYLPDNKVEPVVTIRTYHGENGQGAYGFGNLASETQQVQGQDATLSYAYNDMGALSAITLPNNQRIEMLWDPTGLYYQGEKLVTPPVAVAHKADGKGAAKDATTATEKTIFSYTLDPDYKVVRGKAINDGNLDLINDFQSARVGAVSMISKQNGENISVYAYNPEGMKDKEGQWSTDTTRDYTFDNLDRLSEVIPGSGDKFAAESFTRDDLDVTSAATIDGHELEYETGAAPDQHAKVKDNNGLLINNNIRPLGIRPRTHITRVNFQPEDLGQAVLHPAFLVDFGEEVNLHDMGYNYGWTNANLTGVHKQHADSPDTHHDTYMILPSDTEWRIRVVQGGTYIVKIVCGDPDVRDDSARYMITVNGKLAVDASPTQDDPWVSGKITIRDSGEFISIKGHPDALNNIVNYVEIAGRGRHYAIRNPAPQPFWNPLQGGQEFELHYDGRGNLTNDELYAYSYNDFNRPVEVRDKYYDADPGYTPGLDNYHFTPKTAVYLYDASGRRVATRYKGQDTGWDDVRYVYNGLQRIEERDLETDLLKTRYYYEGGSVNRPCMVQKDLNGDGDFEDAEEELCTITDVRGSVLGVTDKSGNVLEKIYYNAYGLAKPHESGSRSLDEHGLERFRSKHANIGFAGMHIDPFTGKGHTLYREYDPVFGRWLARDPLHEKDSPNHYSYCGANPVDRTDVLGLASVWLETRPITKPGLNGPISTGEGREILLAWSDASTLRGFLGYFAGAEDAYYAIGTTDDAIKLGPCMHIGKVTLGEEWGGKTVDYKQIEKLVGTLFGDKLDLSKCPDNDSRIAVLKVIFRRHFNPPPPSEGPYLCTDYGWSYSTDPAKDPSFVANLTCKPYDPDSPLAVFDQTQAKSNGKSIEVALMIHGALSAGQAAFYHTPNVVPLYHKPTSGANITVMQGRTTTVIGNYPPDMKYILAELNIPQLTGNLDEVVASFANGNPGGLNFLNVSDDLFNQGRLLTGGFFENVNAPWVKAVIQRGDRIIVVSARQYMWRNTLAPNGFGKEVQMFLDHGYRFSDCGTRLLPPVD